MGSGAPSGKRNGRYRNGAWTRKAMASVRDLRAWLKIAKGALEEL